MIDLDAILDLSMDEFALLDIQLYGERIGRMTRLPGERMLFAFEEDYIEDTNRPTLSLGFKDRYGGLLTDLPPTQTQVLPFFSNLLPEGHLREYLARQAGVKTMREFYLLRALGPDLPGAITIRHTAEPVLDYDAEAAAQDKPPMLRFSLAGVQLKFSAILEAQGSFTIPVSGVGGDQIVKLPSLQFEGVPENEFSMMTLAGMVGIEVPPIRLIDTHEIGNLPGAIEGLKGQSFAIERFDRMPDGTRIHIEDFAQVFRAYPKEKYDRASYRNILTVLGAESGNADVAEFIRRLVFSMLIGNADMHLKNWSLIYRDRRQPRLSPAYDLVSTIPYLPQDRAAALTFYKKKRFDEIDRDELARMADKAMVPRKLVMDTAIETVARFREAWPKEKDALPMASSVAEAVDAHLETLPLGRLG